MLGGAISNTNVPEFDTNVSFGAGMVRMEVLGRLFWVCGRWGSWAGNFIVIRPPILVVLNHQDIRSVVSRMNNLIWNCQKNT